MKLAPANHNDMSRAIINARETHHLSSGWVPSQSWYIRDEENLPLGEAQIVVTNNSRYSASCVAVIHFYDRPMEVVLCRGLVEGLERIGYERSGIMVV